jgi:predicted 3-demethylubiquinone-9 3-methyltransferase (glyoxalase superfamily)
MTHSVTPFLMFQDGRAKAAMDLYASLFRGGRIVMCELYVADEAGTEGQVKHGEFEVGGLRVRCIDSPVRHAFDFTPASSLFVECESEAELDALADGLSDGGVVLMAPGSYGFSRKFAWLNDRFGVSWQLILA